MILLCKVILNSKSIVRGVATQGRYLSELGVYQWVTKYHVQYSLDCVNFVGSDEGTGNETVSIMSVCERLRERLCTYKALILPSISSQ